MSHFNASKGGTIEQYKEIVRRIYDATIWDTRKKKAAAY